VRNLEKKLAALRYPAFEYLRPRGPKVNPHALLLAALARNDVDARLVEAFPWLLLEFPPVNLKWLVDEARLHNLQNRLGFVVTVARKLAESTPGVGADSVAVLKKLETELERSRLAEQDTLCEQLPEPQKLWLAHNRSPEAAHWNLLTGWSPESVRYANYQRKARGAMAPLPARHR